MSALLRHRTHFKTSHKVVHLLYYTHLATNKFKKLLALWSYFRALYCVQKPRTYLSYFLERLYTGWCFKWSISWQKLVTKNTNAPDINVFVMGTILDHFRRQVIRGTTQGSPPIFLFNKMYHYHNCNCDIAQLSQLQLHYYKPFFKTMCWQTLN